MSSHRRDALCGVIVVDKPSGPTSARVVAMIKRALGARRVGHTGTLDPMATGVLPICIGAATKLATFLLADDKSYTGEIVLGVSTDTLDAEGTVVAERREAARRVTEPALRAALAALTGDIAQVPPMYSALRQDGVRLHELARAGQSIDRAPRQVRVDRFELRGFESPRFGFAVDCSKGTYIRSLARDVGEALGCGAHLGALRRTRAGVFTDRDAVALDAISPDTIAENLIAPADAIAHLPAIIVEAGLVGRIRNGLQLRWEQLESDAEPPSDRFSILDSERDLLAVARVEDLHLVYERVFQTAS